MDDQDLDLSVFYDKDSDTYTITVGDDVFDDFANVDEVIDFVSNDLGIELPQDIIDQIYAQQSEKDSYDYEDDEYEEEDDDFQ